MDGNAELKRQVNLSNVEAVEAAEASQRAAELKAEEDIANYRKSADRRVYEAERECDEAIEKADEAISYAKKNQYIAWGFLFFTLICCLLVHQVFIKDIWQFISVPIVWLYEKMIDYAVWLKSPTYTKTVGRTTKVFAYSPGSAWMFRIVTIILVIVLVVVIIYGIDRLLSYYKKRWCTLSMKVLLASFASIIVFGEAIHKYLNINLVLFFIIVQLIYLRILVYFDGFYASRSRTKDWESIQNS